MTPRFNQSLLHNRLLAVAFVLFTIWLLDTTLGDGLLAVLSLGASTWPIFLVIGLLYVIVGRDPVRVD